MPELPTTGLFWACTPLTTSALEQLLSSEFAPSTFFPPFLMDSNLFVRYRSRPGTFEGYFLASFCIRAHGHFHRQK